MISVVTVNGSDIFVDSATINATPGLAQLGKLGFGAEGTFTLISNAEPLPVKGQAATRSTTLTRPANTTAYNALGTIANNTSGATNTTLTSVGREAGGTGAFTRARLVTNQKGCTARVKVWFYHTAPTAINDNSPYLYLDADNGKLAGCIEFPAFQTEDPTNSTAAHATRGVDDFFRLPFDLDNGSQTLYLAFETLDAFTPASGQTFFLELWEESN